MDRYLSFLAIWMDKWRLNHSTDEKVKFIVTVNDETLFDNTYKTKNVIEEKFKLTTPKTTSNMHLYTKDGVIRKYDTIYQIIDDHYYERLTMYQKRKVNSLTGKRNLVCLILGKDLTKNYMV